MALDRPSRPLHFPDEDQGNLEITRVLLACADSAALGPSSFALFCVTAILDRFCAHMGLFWRRDSASDVQVSRRKGAAGGRTTSQSLYVAKISGSVLRKGNSPSMPRGSSDLDSVHAWAGEARGKRRVPITRQQDKCVFVAWLPDSGRVLP